VPTTSTSFSTIKIDVRYDGIESREIFVLTNSSLVEMAVRAVNYVNTVLLEDTALHGHLVVLEGVRE
jgi:hypothetical protein